MDRRTVGEAMSRPEALCVKPDASVREVARLMAEHKCGSVLVMEGSALVGIFTERDGLWRVLAEGLDAAKTPVSAAMTREPQTIDAEEPAAEALRRMDELHCWHLPVLRDGKVIGVVALRDLPFGSGLGVQNEIERRHELAERIW
jgi:CBS domain-containing protein